ncbi:MAG: PadR family transcriptional regulator [Chloroflexi bacterium]|nr:PadR family transcriptional regulator [Chloroflexota bacterium]
MSVKHALLGLLTENPKHGYDLKRDFDDRLGDIWNLNYGQIYTTLERLVRDGLVELFDEVSQEDRPDKKIYRITSSGRNELRHWLVQPLKHEPRTLRDELFLKLLFIDLTDPELILQQIREQHSVYMAHMMQLTNRKYQIDGSARRAIENTHDDTERRRIERNRLVSLVVLDAALFHAEADIRWLKHSEARIKELV